MNFKNIRGSLWPKRDVSGLRDGTAIVNTDYHLGRP